MSTQLQTVDKGRPNLLAILANKANLDPEEFSTVVKSTCLPSRQPVSDEQFVAFLRRARDTDETTWIRSFRHWVRQCRRPQ